jgi:signal transduction histidine kinase
MKMQIGQIQPGSKYDLPGRVDQNRRIGIQSVFESFRDQNWSKMLSLMMTRLIYWLLGKRWWLIGLTIFLIVGLQTAEIQIFSFSMIHTAEIVVYVIIILFVGFLLDLQLKNMEIQAQTLKILDIKHRLSLSLAGAGEWDGLVADLVKFPATVANVLDTSLFVRDPISGQFEHSGSWQKNTGIEHHQSVDPHWQGWVEKFDQTTRVFGLCQSLSSTSLPEYCLPILFGDHLVALMRLRLAPGQDLSAAEVDIFKNIGDEMALALKSGQDRKTSTEMHNSETALAERRFFSHYLHDNLGQNLGYLRLKLDQLVNEKASLSSDQLHEDLEHMRAAAAESYEIVRGTLESIHPETTPHLTNLLQEHARKVAERAKFQVCFETRGRPIPLRDDVQSAIFYVCHEVLSNVEKHAQAQNVNLLADWSAPNFTITISDDGIGFNPQTINPGKHFGLEIVHERINNVNGHITLKTSENSGTVVIISVPYRLVGQN